MSLKTSRYNPERIEWLWNGADTRVAVVTQSLLEEFEGKSIRRTKLTKVGRLFNATNRNLATGNGMLRPYVWEGQHPLTVVGFLADRLPELGGALANNSLDIAGLAQKCGEFILDYCDGLTLPE